MKSLYTNVLLVLPVFLFGCRTTAPELQPSAAPEPVPLGRIVQPGAPGASTRVITGAAAGQPAASLHTQADTDFMRGMIAHHAQALEMTAMVPSRSKNMRFGLLSNRIEITQGSEIKLMQQWLRDRGEGVPMVGGEHAHMGHGHSHMMPGMLTPEQMAELKAATGEEFERLFLTYMISHHEGALVMVEDLLSEDGAGQDADIFRFAADVDSDQRMEIARMAVMLSAYQKDDSGTNNQN